MREDLSKKLRSDYPKIFVRSCELSCGDGWYPLLDFLCSAIMNSVRRAQHKVTYLKDSLAEDQSEWTDWQKQNYTPEKLAEAEEELKKAIKNTPTVSQIKEKFGGLRFYVNGGTEEHHNMISMVEAMSYRVCEECGSMMNTTTYTMSWHATLCPKHGEEKFGSDAADFRNRTGRFAPGETNE